MSLCTLLKSKELAKAEEDRKSSKVKSHLPPILTVRWDERDQMKFKRRRHIQQIVTWLFFASLSPTHFPTQSEEEGSNGIDKAICSHTSYAGQIAIDICLQKYCLNAMEIHSKRLYNNDLRRRQESKELVNSYAFSSPDRHLPSRHQSSTPRTDSWR